MNTANSSTPAFHFSAKTNALIALLIFLTITAACGLGGASGTQGDQAVLGGEATLSCTATCSATAQCGPSTDRGTVVLLSTDAPRTEGHHLAIPEGTAVTIVEVRNEAVRRLSSGEAFFLNFYAVQIPDRGATAWVAGYCLLGSPAPAPGG